MTGVCDWKLPLPSDQDSLIRTPQFQTAAPNRQKVHVTNLSLCLSSLSLQRQPTPNNPRILRLLDPIMAMPRSLLQYVCSIVFFLACAQALKFDLQATSQSHDSKKERCVRNFVAKDTLVVVTAIVSGSKGDGMRVNMHVSALPLHDRSNGQTGNANQGRNRSGTQ